MVRRTYPAFVALAALAFAPAASADPVRVAAAPGVAAQSCAPAAPGSGLVGPSDSRSNAIIGPVDSRSRPLVGPSDARSSAIVSRRDAQALCPAVVAPIDTRAVIAPIDSTGVIAPIDSRVRVAKPR